MDSFTHVRLLYTDYDALTLPTQFLLYQLYPKFNNENVDESTDTGQ